MQLARVTSRGRITLPVTVRNALGVDRGDLVRFDVEGKRAVISHFFPDGDVFLKALEGTLGEWLSAADEKAYGDL